MLTDLLPAGLNVPFDLLRSVQEDAGTALIMDRIQKAVGRDMISLVYDGIRPGPAWKCGVPDSRPAPPPTGRNWPLYVLDARNSAPRKTARS